MNKTCVTSLLFTIVVAVSCSESAEPVEETVEQKVQEGENDSPDQEEAEETSDLIPSPTEEIPEGYKFFDQVKGDLNKDGKEDIVLIIKGTDPAKWEMHDLLEEEVDRNRRGIMILFNRGEDYERVLSNEDCFSSENEDGGVYFPPELSVRINNGKLYLDYGHGRYGHWTYNFRYQQEDFKLIGYEYNENFGPITEFIYSYNFLTGKKLTRENINAHLDDPEADEKFEDTWEDLPKKELLSLKTIEDFDKLSF